MSRKKDCKGQLHKPMNGCTMGMRVAFDDRLEEKNGHLTERNEMRYLKETLPWDGAA